MMRKIRFNLSTEAVASFSARYPWLVLAAWAGIVIGAIVVTSTLIGSSLTNEVSFASNSESERAGNLLEERLRGPEQVREML
ncbi:MAG: hypothetical protein ACE5FA_05015, partial [Dehalococcoidia bacterium]